MGELGISLEGILLHLAALIAVAVIVYFTLYKRIKGFMDRRVKEYADAEESIAAEKKQADELKAQYAVLVDKANGRIAQINEEAAAAAELQAKAIIDGAKKNAKLIVEKASGDMLIERAKMKAEFKNEVAEIAVDIAGKILMREIKNADTEKVIDECLGEWTK
ncbi:MAG: ATP synthase F0 subunit B [Clostridiales bacterium]|jgi:F-type H+-transporting ATPase subunit b|nr:ATP synthase F0 subunit B [Clostridiales bacterium]